MSVLHVGPAPRIEGNNQSIKVKPVSGRGEGMAASAYDYVVIGSGAAGCVLAYRLSENPEVSVAVIEAGGRDLHPFFSVPKAVPKLMGRAANLWAYPTEAEPGTGDKVETWLRGRVVGGSTSINGLMYVRGQPADFEAIAELSSPDWNCQHAGFAPPKRSFDGSIHATVCSSRTNLFPWRDRRV